MFVMDFLNMIENCYALALGETDVFKVTSKTNQAMFEGCEMPCVYAIDPKTDEKTQWTYDELYEFFTAGELNIFHYV